MLQAQEKKEHRRLWQKILRQKKRTPKILGARFTFAAASEHKSCERCGGK